MGKFLNCLVYGPNRSLEAPNKWDGRSHILHRDLQYMDDGDKIYTVPAGFVTDGASIPRAFWRVLRPFGKYIEAAVLHDYLYAHPEVYGTTQKEADDLFKLAMRDCGVSKWKRNVMWAAVRVGGFYVYYLKDAERRQRFRRDFK